jgi:mannan endo-1,4-beta-mannosidase
MDLQELKITESLKIFTGPPVSTLVNPKSIPAAQKLMKFLADNYGKMIISGQQDLTWDDKIDMIQRVKDQTGKEPALQGYDFMNLVNGRMGEGGQGQTNEAIAWHKRGGIVAFCWHWRVGPTREFYTNKTDFRIPQKADDPVWLLIDRDLDAVAVELKKLQAAGVPVLWRPLHEASGAWFWWGASGPRLFKEIWNRTFDRLVNKHGLNNLLWVWNGQHPDWYPGDETVDIIGMDIYGEPRQYLAYKDSWVGSQGSVTGNQGKVVALTENGPIPDPDRLVAEQVPWMWFMTWNDGNKNKDDDDFFSGNKYMDLAFKKKVYNHPYVLTLDELQKIKTW